jgi:hypothetical protein
MRWSVLTARLMCLLIVLGLVAATGCGPSAAKLSGTVTYKGTALKGGSVTFVPEGSGETFSAKIQEDGTYAIEHIRTGKYKVCVETNSMKPGGASAAAAYGGKATAAQDRSKIKNVVPPDAKLPEGYHPVNPFSNPADTAQRYVPIPPEYGQPDKTKLSYEVKGGAQQYDIPLD